MTNKHPHKQETVRLTIDFPVKQHTYIKMLATKDGMSLRQYVIQCLPSPEKNNSKKRRKQIGDREFDRALKEFLVEKAPMLKRLSKK